MMVITNGTSPFGRLVVQHLLTRVPAGEIAVTTAEPDAAAELATILNDTSLGEWSVATQALEERLGHDRISLVDALQAASREGSGQSAGS